MMNKIDLEGVSRLAMRYLNDNPPADRQGAFDSLSARLGAYDVDGDTIAASVEAYFAGVSSMR